MGRWEAGRERVRKKKKGCVELGTYCFLHVRREKDSRDRIAITGLLCQDSHEIH
jgi:hypothetical protein